MERNATQLSDLQQQYKRIYLLARLTGCPDNAYEFRSEYLDYDILPSFQAVYKQFERIAETIGKPEYVDNLTAICNEVQDQAIAAVAALPEVQIILRQ